MAVLLDCRSTDARTDPKIAGLTLLAPIHHMDRPFLLVQDGLSAEVPAVRRYQARISRRKAGFQDSVTASRGGSIRNESWKRS
jgi:hypothetical protein